MPSAGPCEQCGAQNALVRLRRNDEAGHLLCERCFRSAISHGSGRARFDLARFFLLLTQPRPVEAALELAPMTDETACPVCGLSYREFADHGLVGCGQCYATFAPAILPALSVLHYSKSTGQPVNSSIGR